MDDDTKGGFVLLSKWLVLCIRTIASFRYFWNFQKNCADKLRYYCQGRASHIARFAISFKIGVKADIYIGSNLVENYNFYHNKQKLLCYHTSGQYMYFWVEPQKAHDLLLYSVISAKNISDWLSDHADNTKMIRKMIRKITMKMTTFLLWDHICFTEQHTMSMKMTSSRETCYN